MPGAPRWASATISRLKAENVVISPNGNFQPGQVVTVSWNTVNRGSHAFTESWSDRLEVVNFVTGQVVFGDNGAQLARNRPWL